MLNRGLLWMVVMGLTMPSSGGENKLHKPWPSKTIYTYQDVATIDVILDLGYYLRIMNESDIKVAQTSFNGSNPFFTYSGCILTDVVTNFAATMKGTVKATSPAEGQWSATFNGYDELSVDTGLTSVQICVLGENVATHRLIGPEVKENVSVAELTIHVIPDISHQ